MSKLQISQSDAAASGLIDVTRTDLNQIVNGRTEGHSLQKLIVIGRQLGLEVDVEIRERGQIERFV
ncbi:hypothetical protein [Ruegeria sp. HKCCA5929]|uniref:hypothetical protein n=1 Tax=Ruegeria sp. HKCCA5929 TaxID=2682988 RepID=UPI0035300D06